MRCRSPGQGRPSGTRSGLTASAGVAPNKFLAKVASGWKKPDGLTVIAPERVETFLQKLPVDALWGVGPVTARKLRALGIERLVDVRGADEARLREAVGSQTEWLRQLAWGQRSAPGRTEPAAQVGRVARTRSPQDLSDIEAIRAEIAELARHCGAWLTRHATLGRTVTLKVRYADFTTITRSASDPVPVADDGGDRRAGTARCWTRTEAGRRRVRLLGVSVHNLTTEPWPDAERAPPPPRLPFPDPAEPHPVDSVP